MNRTVFTNIIRFIVILLAQVLVFKQITFSMGSFAYIHFIIYPLAILLLPVRTPRPVLLLLGFIIGMSLDMIYDSVGVHAAALVFTAYIRNTIIAFLEPFEGYNISDIPSISKMGIGWFVSYVSIAMIIHIFLYFSIEAFSFVFFFDIFLNTIFSFIVSFIVIIISQLIIRTKY